MMEKIDTIKSGDEISPGINDEPSDIKTEMLNLEIKESSLEEEDEKELKIVSLIRKKNKKKKGLPCIFYIFIIFLLLLCGLFVYYILECKNYKRNYSFDSFNYQRPKLNNKKYKHFNFDSGLEVLLIQDEHSEKSAVSISIENGYLDEPYKEGISSMLTNLLYYKIGLERHSISVNDYYGNLYSETDEHYSTIGFDILNNGFFPYLKNFSEILTQPNITNFNFRIAKNRTESNYNSNKYKIEKKEKHLLEYLVYGLNSSDGKDILPEGDNKSLSQKDNNHSITSIIELFNKTVIPSKIKIVLFSRFKLSLMESHFKNYFHNITTLKNSSNKDTNVEGDKNYIYKKINMKRVISLRLKSYEPNYIKVIYFIEDKIFENKTEINTKSQYFNYIIDILKETNNGSLYYKLINNNNFDIKSLTADFEIVLKSKIKFTILVELNSYSLKNINDILYILYHHMDKIVNEAVNENFQNERYKDLEKIHNQKFIFAEDDFDISKVSKASSINLLKQKDFNYFFFESWVPEVNNSNLEKEISHYLGKLKPENSVVIIGIKDEDINEIRCNNNSKLYLDCQKLFNNEPNKTEYYEISYNWDELDTSFISEFENEKEYTNINYHKNEYISNKTELVNIVDKNGNKDEPEIIGNHSLNSFYFIKDKKFGLPKLQIFLDFLHPFIRPMNKEKQERDCLYFKLLEYFSAVYRNINITLSDAIRAGNIIKFGYNENQIYLTIAAYSDVAYKILEKINQIIFLKDWEQSDFFTKNERYKIATLEDFLNFQQVPLDFKFKYYFYSSVKSSLYNKFEFDKKNFDYGWCLNNSKLGSLYQMNKYIIEGLVYGDYSKDEATKLVEIFNQSTSGFDSILVIAGNNLTNITDFSRWIKNVRSLDGKIDSLNINKNIANKNKDNIGYRYIYWSKYNQVDVAKSSLLSVMFSRRRTKRNDKLQSASIFFYNGIYFQFIFRDNEDKSINPNCDSNMESALDNLINNTDIKYNDYIDNIGSRFYYLQRNFIQTLSEKQSTFEKYSLQKLNSIFFPQETKNEYNQEQYEKYIMKIKLKDLLDDFNKKILNNPKLDINTL